MKTFVRSAVAAGVVVLASSMASADVIVGWSFPTAFPTGAGNVPTGTSYLPPGPNGDGVADSGANLLGSQFISVHSNAAATYTSPAGNGSQFSFSSNNWGIGDYYQATFSTLGFQDVSLSWDQARSSTGPGSFRLRLSLDGGASFSNLLDYAVLQSGGGGAPGTWTTSTYNPLYTQTFVLGASVANQASVIVRFEALVAASAATGSNRIDNVVFSGTVIPAPGAIALLGVAGLVSRRRRG